MLPKPGFLVRAKSHPSFGRIDKGIHAVNLPWRNRYLLGISLAGRRTHPHTVSFSRRKRRRKREGGGRRGRKNTTAVCTFIFPLPNEKKRKGRKSLFFTSGDYSEDNDTRVRLARSRSWCGQKRESWRRARHSLDVGGRLTNLFTPLAKLLINEPRVNALQMYCLYPHPCSDRYSRLLLSLSLSLSRSLSPASMRRVCICTYVVAAQLKAQCRRLIRVNGRWPQLSYVEACSSRVDYIWYGIRLRQNEEIGYTRM